MFDELLNDVVSLVKKDGSRKEGIKASVQKKKIFVQGSNFLIEPGDFIQRKMSNGGEETYEVIDPGFHEKFLDIPAGYQMEVRKLGLPEARKAIGSITYNITGHNNRINQNSVDKSTNTFNQISSEINESISGLREEVERLIKNSDERKSALEVVDAIEHQFQTGTAKTSVVGALVKALPAAGSIASIGSYLMSLIP